jgi:hypothetical protein
MHTRAVSTAQHDLTMATFWVNIAGARGATLIDIYIFTGGSGRGAASTASHVWEPRELPE